METNSSCSFLLRERLLEVLHVLTGLLEMLAEALCELVVGSFGLKLGEGR